MDADIIKFVKDKYKLLIGDRTAEQIKLEIGSAVKDHLIKHLKYVVET